MAGFIFVVIGILFLLFVVAMVVYSLYDMFRKIVLFFFKDQLARLLLFRNLNTRSKIFLQKYFLYYRNLSDKDKRLFERRVQKFMDMKEFVPRGELKEVSLEMKTLIAASAIQITFGLPAVYLRTFYRILVYPNDYYSTITHRYHRGEVNTRGFIVLSWSNLVDGYANNTDGRNLGLHEMAHALKIVDAFHSEEQNFFDQKTFIHFINHAREEMMRIQMGEESFFREYAATNDHEFFAVAVENFFERSGEFRDYHPELYSLLGELLNQNPSRQTS
jgi:Mlc titration factor MtfA (ptsG expression regulator)